MEDILRVDNRCVGRRRCIALNERGGCFAAEDAPGAQGAGWRGSRSDVSAFCIVFPLVVCY